MLRAWLRKSIVIAIEVSGHYPNSRPHVFYSRLGLSIIHPAGIPNEESLSVQQDLPLLVGETEHLPCRFRIQELANPNEKIFPDDLLRDIISVLKENRDAQWALDRAQIDRAIAAAEKSDEFIEAL